MNIVHAIDMDTVDEQIKQQCERYLKLRDTRVKAAKESCIKYVQDPNKFARKPDSAYDVRSIWNGCITLEKEHYSSVRVIELPIDGKRFILVYGNVANDTVTSGTGPFESLEKATTWFINGGR